jgi:hypothetical protein
VGKKMVHNPVSGEGQTREIFVIPESVQQRIAELELALELEKKKPAVIKTQERVVEKEIIRDDPKLLERYNAAMKELGLLKATSMLGAPVEITRIVREKVTDQRQLYKWAIGGAAAWQVFILFAKLIASHLM